jgi:L-lactate dehydrogenase complex protein LldG
MVARGARVTARDEVLARVRAAVKGGAPAPEPPRDYRRSDDAARAEIVERFVTRAGEYTATVRRALRGDVADAVGEACRKRGVRRLAVPADLPRPWLPPDVEAVPDSDLGPRELDGLDGALTGSELAIAETGTVVLAGGPGQGRRALTLVPDLHVCVVEEDRIAGIVPEAVAALEPAVREGRPITLISGPSATSDIELSRVEGVHGPRTLEIVVAG